MHVPWLAMQPIRGRNQMKWLDWVSALGIMFAPRNIGPSNTIELCASWLDESPVWSQRLERRGRLLRGLGRELFIDRSAHRLSGAAQLTPNLSADSAIKRAHSAMLDKPEDLERDINLHRDSSKRPYGKTLRVK